MYLIGLLLNAKGAPLFLWGERVAQETSLHFETEDRDGNQACVMLRQILSKSKGHFRRGLGLKTGCPSLFQSYDPVPRLPFPSQAWCFRALEFEVLVHGNCWRLLEVDALACCVPTRVGCHVWACFKAMPLMRARA